MGEKYQAYRKLNYSLPEKSWTWNLYGAGLENLGRSGEPEPFSIPEPNDDQLLVRIDTVSVCFSDVKILKQGGSHPKLYNRNLALDPTRLGHEVSLTIVKVGRNLQDRYKPGQRLAVQPDIYQQGKSTAYGYTVPGGMIQFHLIGDEVLKTDTGACLLPLEEDMGYAESSLLEPWGCVMAAYTQRRRLTPKKGGSMWIIGQPGDSTPYTFSAGLDSPASIILTDVPASVKGLVSSTGAKVIERNGLASADYESLSRELTNGVGFDDIVILNPTSASDVSQIARFIARRGTCNLVGAQPLDGLVQVDLGRLHYDYIAFIGTNGTDVAASYGEARNRCELRAGGSTPRTPAPPTATNTAMPATATPTPTQSPPSVTSVAPTASPTSTPTPALFEIEPLDRSSVALKRTTTPCELFSTVPTPLTNAPRTVRIP